MFKRLFDIVASAVALVMFAPLLAFISWQVLRKMGSPVLFRQVRPGLHGKPFEMIKFRTMRDALDAQGNPLPDAERLVPFGKFLRASSLDELPELWNVLKGEMSLVGPRPLLMEYLPLYSLEQARRHEVRPGVTGWAQVNGRNALGWDEKFKLDVWYVDNQSFWLDVKILFLTVKKVLVKDGISADGHVTMPPFKGGGMNDKRNILILSAGRRVDLVQAFQAALARYFPDAHVYATDMRPELAAACHVADMSFTAPRVNSSEYIDFLIDLCVRHSIGMLVPTIDTELLVLASHRARFAAAGISAVVSDPSLVAACRDKRLTAEVFTQIGIDQPAIYSKDTLSFPCFCKPYDGSCSIGAKAVHSPEMLTPELLANEKNMFMELIGKEFREYTIDAYFTDEGRLCALVPRERIEVRAGEVSKGVTRKHFVYDYMLDKLPKLEGARGCITFQVFGNPDTRAVKALEINPRFGGGYPLSHEAGVDYPDWLIREFFLGESLPFRNDWEADLLMLRYDAKVIVREANPT